ncbi:hypothetical protein ACWDV4_10065 [Micromonospora sp. NPDC003197]
MASIEKVQAALAQPAEQGKQQVAEAATLIQGSSATAREYSGLLS